jgi:hypothetical protein
VKRLVVVLVLAIACGKRGDPRPPVPVIPQATSDLVVTQRGSDIVLTWGYPSLTTAGKSLTSIRRVSVFRYSEPLPPSAVVTPRDTAAPEPAVPDAVTLFAKIPTLTAAQFAKLSTRVHSIEGANLGSATVGARLEYRERPPVQTPAGQPIRYTYAVVTEGINARSDLSNLMAIVPLPVAAPPPRLTAAAETEGVRLQWPTPTTTASGSGKPVIAGYDIYRDDESLEKPVNPTPVTAATYLDQPPYGEHTYRVTAVASAGPPKIQSDPSPAARATFKDLVPPPPPASVTTLLETNVVRLIWDPVQAVDLVGYNVYRTEGTGRIKLTPHPTTDSNFLDESVSAGIEYFYSVTSVDKSGNESPATNSERILVPKTP